jgi:hypothetical protein
MSSEKSAEEKSSYGSWSQPHFIRVIATTMMTITRCICHNAQRSLIYLLEKLRKGRGVYIPGRAIFAWRWE